MPPYFDSFFKCIRKYLYPTPKSSVATIASNIVVAFHTVSLALVYAKYAKINPIKK